MGREHCNSEFVRAGTHQVPEEHAPVRRKEYSVDMKKVMTLVIASFVGPASVLTLGLPPSTQFGAPYAFAEHISVSTSGSIQSYTSSSASTGGNSVGSGGVIKTGNASASSQSEVHSGSGGTTVDIRVEAEANGEKKSESVHKVLEPGESVTVHVSASSTSGGKGGNKDVRAEVLGAVQASESASASTSGSAAETSLFSTLFEEVPFKHVFENVRSFVRTLLNTFRFW